MTSYFLGLGGDFLIGTVSLLADEEREKKYNRNLGDLVVTSKGAICEETTGANAEKRFTKNDPG